MTDGAPTPAAGSSEEADRRGRVLLGFDGTPRSWVAMRWVEQEAPWRTTSLELLAVPGPAPERDVTASIGGARRMLMGRHPSLDVGATVVMSDDAVTGAIGGADLLVLGWTGVVADLHEGLGGVGVRLLRASTVPVLVVQAGRQVPCDGPVVLLLSSSTSGRAFEAAIEECRRRSARLCVVGAVSAVTRAVDGGPVPSLVVAAHSQRRGRDGLGPRDAARLVVGSPSPVLLVPPQTRTVPPPRRASGRPVVRAGPVR